MPSTEDQFSGARSSPPSLHRTLGDRLKELRRPLFVGRTGERGQFLQIIEQRSIPRILAIRGAPGIGKSMLLSELLALAGDRGLPSRRIDARNLAAITPTGLSQAINTAVNEEGTTQTLVIAIDNVEQIPALESCLNQHLLPLLPERAVLILAGRWEPPASWRTDPALAPLVVDWPLAELDEPSVQTYLQRRGLDPEQQRAVFELARGYPLAMALAAEHLQRNGEQNFGRLPPRDIIRSLVTWLITEAERRNRLPALEAAATVQRLDIPLLKALLNTESVTPYFRWLASRPFVEEGEGGLVMHELVRSVVIQDLRQRDLNRHYQLIRRAAAYYLRGQEPADPWKVHPRLADTFYILRWEPFIQYHYALGSPTHYLDEPDPGEHPALAEMVERLEGKSSRRWFEYWQGRSPHTFRVVRDGNRQAVGLLLALLLHPSELEAASADPAVGKLTDYLSANDLLDHFDRVLLVRFGMADPGHQERSPAFTQIAMLENSLMFTSGISLLSAVLDRERDWWGAEQYTNMRWLPGTEYEDQNRKFRLAGYDLTTEPPLVCARNCLERILGAEGKVTDRPPRDQVIRRDTFREAVLQALRGMHDDSHLAGCDLLRAQIVIERQEQSGNDGPAAIRGLLTEAAQALCSEVPDKKLPEIVAHAYFRTGDKQLTAAESLCISERTFRRRLREAERRLVDNLWSREIRLTTHSLGAHS